MSRLVLAAVTVALTLLAAVCVVVAGREAHQWRQDARRVRLFASLRQHAAGERIQR